jgi:hypothetical protein
MRTFTPQKPDESAYSSGLENDHAGPGLGLDMPVGINVNEVI